MNPHTINNQDWTPVVMTRKQNRPEDKAKELRNALRTGAVEHVPKNTSNTTNTKSTSLNGRKLENMIDGEDSRIEIKMIHRVAVDAVKRRRCELKLTQKELATKASVPEQTVKSLEAGTERHNPQLLTKLQRVLGVKLLGEDGIGEALLPKKP